MNTKADLNCARLRDCLAEDQTAAALRRWSNSLKSTGFVLAVIIWVIGLIITILNITGTLLTVEYSSGLLAFLTPAIEYFLYGFFIWCAFKAISMLIDGLSKVVQYTKETARLTELQTLVSLQTDTDGQNNEQKAKAQEDIPIDISGMLNEDGTVICPICRLPQKPDRSICYNCGKQFVLHQTVEFTEYKKCPECGMSIGAKAIICNHCGAEQKTNAF